MQKKIALLLALFQTNLLVSVESTWTAAGGGSWNTTGNWNTGVVPENIDDVANFPTGLATQTITINTSVIVGEINFNNTNQYTIQEAVAQNLTMNSSSLNPSIAVANGSHIISAPISIASSQTLDLNPTSGTLTISGIISGATSSIEVDGAGTVIFSEANTYAGTSGGTTITNGTLQLNGSNRLPVGKNLAIQSNGTLDLQGNTQTIGELSGAGTIDLGSMGGLTCDFVSLLPEFSGSIQGMNGTLTKQNVGTLTLSGNNTYTGDTTISGGTLQIQGNGSSLPGNAVVNLGGTLAFNQSGAGTFSNDITGAGTLTKLGSAKLILSSTNNTYSGATRIEAGTLSISNANNIQGTSGFIMSSGANLETTASLTSAKDIEMDAGAAITLTTTNSGNTTTWSGSISQAGAGASLTKAGGGVLVLSGANDYSGGTNVEMGTLRISNVDNLPAGTIGMEANTTLNVITNNIVLPSSRAFALTTDVNFDTTSDLTISGIVSGDSILTKLGSGTLFLNPPSPTFTNTYTGGTNINAGILTILNDASLGTGSAVSMANSTTLKAAGAFTSAKNITISGTSTATIDTNGHDVTLSGEIAGPNSTLQKIGAGVLTLSGPDNSYSGFTTIAAGTVSVSSDANLGGSAATINMSGSTLQATDSFTTSRPVDITTSATIDVTGSEEFNLGGTITESAMASTLTKTGTGKLILSSSGNSYSGLTTISGGTLSISANDLLGDLMTNAGVTMAAGTTIETTNTVLLTSARNFSLSNGTHFFDIESSPTTLTGIISGAGASLVKQGLGTLNLNTATNTYSGVTTIAVGTLGIDSANSLQGTSQILMGDAAAGTNGTLKTTSTLTLAKGIVIQADRTATIDVDNTGGANTMTISSAINQASALNPGALTKTGLGTLLLSGTNGYSGGTTISQGALSISSNANLGNIAGGVAMQNGTTLLITGDISTARTFTLTGNANLSVGGGNTLTLGSSGKVTGTSSLTKQDTGTLILASTDNDYSGPTILEAGIVSISNDANLGASTGALIFSGGGGTLNTTGTTITSSRGITLTSLGTIDTDATNTILGGDITGASGLTKTGTGKLTLTGTNDYLGTTIVSAGTLEGNALSIPGDVANAATVVFNQGEVNGTYSSAVTGASGTLSKIGPFLLTFDSSSSLTQDSVSITEGNLFVNTTSFTAPVSVSNGGTLGGTGLITGNVDINAQGIMAPGTSIGTTTVAGTYTQAANSAFEFEFNTTSADLLSVTGAPAPDGQANLAGHLRLIPLPDSGYSNHVYTIITTESGIVGTFDTDSIDGSLFTYVLNYGANTLTVEIAYLNINTAGLPRNAAAVASCLDAIQQTVPPAGSDFEMVFEDLVLILGRSELIDALEQLHPAAFKALPYTQQTNAILVQSLLSKRLKNFYQSNCDRPASHRSFWADATFDATIQGNRGENAGYSALTGAWILGGDTLYKGDLDNPYLGVFGAVTYSSVGLKQKKGSGDVTSLYISAYTGWKYSLFDFNASVLGFFTGYEGTRRIDFTDVFDSLTIARDARNCHRGGGFDGRLQAALQWKRGETNQFTYRPYVTFDYIYLSESGYTERDANSLNLEVEDARYHLIRPEVGFDFNVCYGAPQRRGYVQASLAGAYEYELKGSHYRAKFQGEPCQFQVKGIHRDRLLAIPSLTWGNFLKDGKYVLSLHYEGKFATRFTEQTAGIQFLY